MTEVQGVRPPPAELTARDRARLMAPQLKALGDEHRMLLALLLAERPRTVRELQDETGMSQTLVSYHLAPLREQGMVSVTPRGRANVYTLCCDRLGKLVRRLAAITDAPDEAGPCFAGGHLDA